MCIIKILSARDELPLVNFASIYGALKSKGIGQNVIAAIIQIVH